jgi:hypothetical protein
MLRKEYKYCHPENVTSNLFEVQIIQTNNNPIFNNQRN